jgi:hypothetical protein
MSGGREQPLQLVGLDLERRLPMLHIFCDLFAVRLELVACGFVAVDLAGLRKQDQRCSIGRLGREREVEENERVGIPTKADCYRVEGDPGDDQRGLAKDVLRRAKEAGGRLGASAEGVSPKALVTSGISPEFVHCAAAPARTPGHPERC